MTLVRVYIDRDDINLKAYRTCLDWCREERILIISDLADRILTEPDYSKLWLERCSAMHRKLKGS